MKLKAWISDTAKAVEIEEDFHKYRWNPELFEKIRKTVKKQQPKKEEDICQTDVNIHTIVDF